MFVLHLQKYSSNPQENFYFYDVALSSCDLVADATIHSVKTSQCDKEIFCETMSRSSTKVVTFTIHKIIPDGWSGVAAIRTIAVSAPVTINAGVEILPSAATVASIPVSHHSQFTLMQPAASGNTCSHPEIDSSSRHQASKNQ